jgi:hypothetical protein
VVHGEDAVLHRGEDRLLPGLLPGDLVEALLELVGGVVQDPAQLAELVATAHADAGGEVAHRELAGRFHDLAQRCGERGGEYERDEEGGRGGEGEGEPERPPQLRHLRAHCRGGERDAGDPDHPRVGPDRHRGVDELVVDGGAVARDREGLAF